MNTRRKTKSAIKTPAIVNNKSRKERSSTNGEHGASFEPLTKKDKISGSDLDNDVVMMTQSQSQEQWSQVKRKPKSLSQLVNSNSGRVRQPFKRVRPGSVTVPIIASSYESDTLQDKVVDSQQLDLEKVLSPFTTVPWSPYKKSNQRVQNKVDDLNGKNKNLEKDPSSTETDSSDDSPIKTINADNNYLENSSETSSNSSDSPIKITDNAENNLKSLKEGNDPPTTIKEEVESQEIDFGNDNNEEPLKDVKEEEESQEIDVVNMTQTAVKEEGPNSFELNIDLEKQPTRPVINDNLEESPSVQNSLTDSQLSHSDSSCDPVTPPESQYRESSDLPSPIDYIGSPLNLSILPLSKISSQPSSQLSTFPSTNLPIVSPLTRSTLRKNSKPKFLDLSKFAKFIDENPPRLLLSLLPSMLHDRSSWGSLATAITRQLDIKKDEVEVLDLDYPLGFLGDQIQWPSGGGGMPNVKTLEVHYGRRSDFSQHRKYDLLMLSKNFDWSSTFPSLINVILYWHGLWLTQKLEIPTAPPPNLLFMATSVKTLEVHTSDLLLLMGETLPSLFPQVEYLCVKGLEDFPTVCHHIWNFTSVQSLQLEIMVGSRMPRNAYPHLDTAFTGFEIQQESGENDFSYDESRRVRSSILDLKDLNTLSITMCDPCLYPKYSYHLLTKVTGQYTFSKFGAEFRPQILASSFYGQNTGRIVESLKSLEPYCDIRAESE